MARKRMIDPSIWASNDFAELDPFAQLVWIGLFSNADDEGRGIAKSAYIKSILFPYSEDLRLIKQVDKALNEIAKYMSITFYKIDKNEFYELSNWKKWQKVEKMQQSKIPAFDSPESIQIRCGAEQSGNIRGTVGEQSGNIRGTVSPNKKRREIEENRIEDKIDKNACAHAREGDQSSIIFHGVVSDCELPEVFDKQKVEQAFEESEYLKQNCHSLKWIIANYEKIVCGYYKDFKECKFQDKRSDFSKRQYSKEFYQSLITPADEIEI